MRSSLATCRDVPSDGSQRQVPRRSMVIECWYRHCLWYYIHYSTKHRIFRLGAIQLRPEFWNTHIRTFHRHTPLFLLLRVRISASVWRSGCLSRHILLAVDIRRECWSCTSSVWDLLHIVEDMGRKGMSSEMEQTLPLSGSNLRMGPHCFKCCAPVLS